MDYGALIGILVFLGMFALIVLGVPMYISMAGAALAGFWLLGGQVYAFQQFSTGAYYITSNFGFAVVPLFTLMSVLAADCGVASAAYEAAVKWFGNMRGGLLVATVVASAIFGACCGMPLAAIAVFTKIAVPELEKCNYEKAMSLGCIAVSGSLSGLIPPSVTIIIFCILVEQSIGRALVAGILPGILLVVLLTLAIYVMGIIKPQTMPRMETKVSWKEKFASLGLVGPVLFLIVLIIGGMYFGVFAPTVGGAIGSLGVLIIAVIRRIKIKTLMGSFLETVIINAEIFPLVIAGFLLARFVTLSGLPKTLTEIISAASLSPYVLMSIIVVFYIFIGCIMEFFAVAIVTLPLVFPLLIGAGFNPIAVIIILIVLISIAGVTPPLGMGAFIVASVANVKPELVFRGILPFLIATVIQLILIIIFPEIVTWLPDVFYG